MCWACSIFVWYAHIAWLLVLNEPQASGSLVGALRSCGGCSQNEGRGWDRWQSIPLVVVSRIWFENLSSSRRLWQVMLWECFLGNQYIRCSYCCCGCCCDLSPLGKMATRMTHVWTWKRITRNLNSLTYSVTRRFNSNIASTKQVSTTIRNPRRSSGDSPGLSIWLKTFKNAGL